MRRFRVKAHACPVRRPAAIPAVSGDSAVTPTTDGPKTDGTEPNKTVKLSIETPTPKIASESSKEVLSSSTNEKSEKREANAGLQSILSLQESDGLQKLTEIFPPTPEAPNQLHHIIENNEIQSVLSGNDNSCPSPTKSQSDRCFARRVLRIDVHSRVRKNSVQGSGASASESEDDSKRQTTKIPRQTRLDDTIQAAQEAQSSNNNVTDSTTTSLSKKRKGLISDSAKKLVEARREFQRKHENKEPDRRQLKMYDLIYYNPASNPMKDSGGKKKSKPHPIVERPVERVHEDAVDDPDETFAPAPKVIVGSDGRLILDTKSTIIENTGAKEAREEREKNEVVIDDNENGNGFYKRRQRSKDWNKFETIKFYKALNRVGTDFSLMLPLFSNRTRQDLKLKFKKEEKINRPLVEKALSTFQEYDIESLKEDLAIYDGVEIVNLESGLKESLGDVSVPKKRTKNRRTTVLSIAQQGDNDENLPQKPKKPRQRLKKARQISTKKTSSSKLKKKSIQTITSDFLSRSEESSTPESENDSEINEKIDFEVYKPRPTRSGRKPKSERGLINQQQNIDNFSNDNNAFLDNDGRNGDIEIDELSQIKIENCEKQLHEFSVENLKNSITNIGSVEPGSLVIVSKELPDEPGKTVVQVYMVNGHVKPGQTNIEDSMTPVDLSPEMLSLVTNEMSQTSSAQLIPEV